MSRSQRHLREIHGIDSGGRVSRPGIDPRVPAEAPGAPTGLAVTPGNTQNTLNWSAPSSDGGSAITGYEVEFSTNGGSTWTSLGDVGDVLTYGHTGLTNGTTYTYQVSAINAIDTGAPSNTDAGTPAA